MKHKLYVLLLLPGTVFLVAFLVIPLILMAISSFMTDSNTFSFSGYASLMVSTYFRQVLVRSLKLALISTVISAVVGFPASYFIAKLTRNKGLFIAMTIFPMLTSPVVRSFSWMVILGQNGIVNSFLTTIGVINSPIRMLYNEFSMVIGFVQLFMPLMILSLVSAMENIGDDLLLAAESLGAPRAKAFMKVVLPMSISGIITGSVLVFTGCLTAYTTPQLLGGSKTMVLATLIYQDAMSISDWQSASMVAVVMIIVTIVVSGLINGFAKKLNPIV
jgi:putative spermidine/putrescine transport system permease protein